MPKCFSHRFSRTNGFDPSSAVKICGQKESPKRNRSDSFVGFGITAYKDVSIDGAGLARRVYVAIKLFTLTCLILDFKMRRHQHGYY